MNPIARLIDTMDAISQWYEDTRQRWEAESAADEAATEQWIKELRRRSLLPLTDRLAALEKRVGELEAANEAQKGD